MPYSFIRICQEISPNDSIPLRKRLAFMHEGIPFYNMLPDTFTKKDYDAAVLTLGENGSTANKWIEAFIKDGKLCRIEQGGECRKIF